MHLMIVWGRSNTIAPTHLLPMVAAIDRVQRHLHIGIQIAHTKEAKRKDAPAHIVVVWHPSRGRVKKSLN